MFSRSSLQLQPGELLLLTDQLLAPADFVIFELLLAELKAGSRCIFLSFESDVGHLRAILSKMSPGLNITKYINNGSLILLGSLASTAQNPTRQADLASKAIHADIQTSLTSDKYNTIDSAPQVPPNSTSRTIVVLDSVSYLEWTSTPILEIKRLVRALQSLCSKEQASLLIHHHITMPEGIDPLLRQLLGQCALHLEVLPLASGRSGMVSGEIILHPGTTVSSKTLSSAQSSLSTRSKATQYRLTDSGPHYFERGNSAAAGVV